MVAYLLSPNRCHWQLAKVKNYNLIVTEVRYPDFKNNFSEIFNFTAGIHSGLHGYSVHRDEPENENGRYVKSNGLCTKSGCRLFKWTILGAEIVPFHIVQFQDFTVKTSDLIPSGDPSKENESYWKVLKIYSREWLVYKRGLEYVRNIFSNFEKTWISHKERFLIFHWATNQSLRLTVVGNNSCSGICIPISIPNCPQSETLIG